MAEKVLEKPICKACGVDVRPHSMFCYNCGGAVSDTITDEKTEIIENNGKNSVSDVWLRESVTDENETEKELKTEEIAEKPIVSEENTPLDDLKEKLARNETVENGKLKSAATMRRKAKSFQAKPVEVVWEEPENFSSVKLILVALLLTLLAVALVGFALYLK